MNPTNLRKAFIHQIHPPIDDRLSFDVFRGEATPPVSRTKTKRIVGCEKRKDNSGETAARRINQAALEDSDQKINAH